MRDLVQARNGLQPVLHCPEAAHSRPENPSVSVCRGASDRACSAALLAEIKHDNRSDVFLLRLVAQRCQDDVDIIKKYSVPTTVNTLKAVFPYA